MTEIFVAIYNFLSQVGVPVYPENGGPVGAVLPYLTWTPVEPEWDTEAVLTVRIWSRGPSYRELAGLVDQLGALLEEPAVLETPGGFLYLSKGDPWAQPQPLQGSDVLVMYLNIGLQAFL